MATSMIPYVGSHTPSFRFEQTAPGWAVCIDCGQLITLDQLAGERCPGAERRAA